MRRAKLIDTPEGPMTRHEAAARSGRSLNTIIRRVYDGWPAERLFDPPLRGKASEIRRYDTGWGLVTLPKVALLLNISPQALRYRLEAGWTEDDAFNTLPMGREHYRTSEGAALAMPWEEWYRRKAQNKGSIQVSRVIHDNRIEI